MRGLSLRPFTSSGKSCLSVGTDDAWEQGCAEIKSFFLQWTNCGKISLSGKAWESHVEHAADEQMRGIREVNCAVTQLDASVGFAPSLRDALRMARRGMERAERERGLSHAVQPEGGFVDDALCS